MASGTLNLGRKTSASTLFTHVRIGGYRLRSSPAAQRFSWHRVRHHDDFDPNPPTQHIVMHKSPPTNDNYGVRELAVRAKWSDRRALRQRYVAHWPAARGDAEAAREAYFSARVIPEPALSLRRTWLLRPSLPPRTRHPSRAGRR